jgi:hypothetical protein
VTNTTTGITLITITGKIAEIIIDPTSKAITADELARFMLAHGITVAEIIKPKTRLSDDPGSKSPVT